MGRICVIGDVNVDIVSKLREPLQINSDTQTSNVISLGGSPCNMSMWLANIGAQVRFLAAVGDDLLGTWIKAQLTLGNLSIDSIQTKAGARSGTCIILVSDDGQRTMLPDPAANLQFEISQNEQTEITGSSVVVMSAYSFLRPETRHLASKVSELVKNCGARLVLDAASSAPIAEVGVQAVRNYLADADLILANEDEFALLNQPEWTAQIPDLVVKLGPNGAKWLRFGQEVCTQGAMKVDVVDTTGAGDSFLAGLISVLSEHEDWFAISDDDRQIALRRASEVASLNISSVGAGPL